MRAPEEVAAMLSKTRDWLDENEGSGFAEEGVQTGWEQALAWVMEADS